MSDIEHSLTLHSSVDSSCAPYVVEQIKVKDKIYSEQRHDCEDRNPVHLMRDLAAWNGDRMAFGLGAPKPGTVIHPGDDVSRFTFAIVSCAKGGCFVEVSATVNGEGKRIERYDLSHDHDGFKKVAALATDEDLAFGFFKAVNTPSKN